MRNTLFMLLCLMISLSANAQGQQEPTFNQRLVADQKIHDFGKILEEKGPMSHTFVLKNTGKTNIAINEVTAWCGCTTTQFSKQPILPGKEGRVTVTYNPHYRPGKFSKEVVVLTDGGSSYLRLWVKGEVVPMEHPITDDHPYHYGEGLYMSHLTLPFPALRKGQEKTFSLRLANNTNRPMTVEMIRQPQNRVLQMPEKIVLKPKERRVVKVSYKAVREYSWKRRIDIVPRVNGMPVRPLRITFLPAK